MTKILSGNTSFTGQIQKIVELSKGYIINGQYYNKSNLSPKALKFFKTSGSTQDLSMSRKLMIKYGVASYQTDNSLVVTDINDSEITYVFSITTRSNVVNFFKFRETEDDVKLLMENTYTSLPSTGSFPKSYAGQDDTNLYYIFQTNVTGGTGHFVKINKKTLALESITTLSTYNPSAGTVLLENDTYIFFGSQRNYGDISLYRYSKLTNLLETITVPNHKGKGYFGSSMSNLLKYSENIGETFAVHQEPLTGEFYINRYLIDVSEPDLTKIVTSDKKQTVTWTGFAKLPTITNLTTSVFNSFVVEANDGKKILVVSLYEVGTVATAVDIPNHGFYTFEILPDDELVALHFTPISSTSTRGFISTTNKKLVVASTDSTVYFLNFDEVNKKYLVSDTMDVLPSHVGIDLDDNIWFVNGSEEVEMISANVPTNVEINFEKQNYKFEGVDINTHVDIDAKNYLGNRVGVKLELSIRGEAVFESNNTKIVQEITDLTGPKRVNIVLKGSGGITIYPKLII